MTKTSRTIRPVLLGLAGHANAGKDTVAQLISIHAGAARFAFSDGLYQEVGRAFGVSIAGVLAMRSTKDTPMDCLALYRCMSPGFVEALPDHIRAEPYKARSPRNIMQWWSTEYRRAQNPAYWVAAAQQTILGLWTQASPPPGIVVTDVRFPNEAELIRNLGGFIWKVERPGSSPVPTGHISEAQGEFRQDLAIGNTHDIRHLQSTVLPLWKELQDQHATRIDA